MAAFDIAKVIAALFILLLIAGGLRYVINTKASLVQSENNNKVLIQSVNEQSTVIDNLKNDITEIRNINDGLLLVIQGQQKEIDDLNDKFNVSANGHSRDLGAITRVKPKLINKIINNASNKVNRCFEIATGATLKEGEKNDECKELVNSGGM